MEDTGYNCLRFGLGFLCAGPKIRRDKSKDKELAKTMLNSFFLPIIYHIWPCIVEIEVSMSPTVDICEFIIYFVHDENKEVHAYSLRLFRLLCEVGYIKSGLFP